MNSIDTAGDTLFYLSVGSLELELKRNPGPREPQDVFDTVQEHVPLKTEVLERGMEELVSLGYVAVDGAEITYVGEEVEPAS